MKRKLWTLLLALGAALALCVGAGATTDNDFFQALSMGEPVRPENDFTYSGLLYVYSSLTIDLNGYVLEIPDGIYVAQGARLTIKDSSTELSEESRPTHKFSTPNLGGRWVLDESAGGTEGEDYQTVTEGVITGGTGKQDLDHPTLSGGGIYVAPGGSLTMTGGSIVGCSAQYGGGVYVDGGGNFTMNGSAAIIGCAAGTDGGGGVYVSGTFTMNGSSAITNCTTDIGETGGTGGGVWVEDTGTLTMNDNSAIRDCTARTGGGVTVNSGESRGQFIMNGGQITGCKTTNDTGGGGIFNSGEVTMTGDRITSCTAKPPYPDVPESGGVRNQGPFTMSGGTIEAGCTIFSVSSNSEIAFTISGSASISADITNCSTLHADGGSVCGEVKNGYRDYPPGTDTVTRTMTLTAKWVQTHTVTFDTNGGSAVGPVTVDANSTVTEPIDPTKSGYNFGGWYKENTFQTPWNFDTDTVTANLTLYAKWNAIVYSDPTYAVSAPTAENGKVAVSPRYAERGERVTVTITPDEGYEPENLTATDSRGNALELTDLGGGRYRFTMPARRVEVKASFVKTVEVSPFADVATDAYCYEAVKWAVKNGITDGVGNDLFGPNQPCTRAQIVTFLWRAAGSPEPMGAGTFSNVPADSYYAEAVAWASANGVTEGVGSGLFAPDSNCTRGQIVTFLWRAYNK